MQDDETGFQKRLAYIQSLPEGQEREEAIADLSRDYPGRMAVAESELAEANQALDSSMVMPQTQTAGPSSNPFAVAVAPNALEYAAQGLRGYNAVQDRDRLRGEIEELSLGKERATGGVMDSMAAQASALRQPAVDAMANTDFGRVGPGGSTPEDYMKYLKKKEEEELWGGL